MTGAVGARGAPDDQGRAAYPAEVEPLERRFVPSVPVDLRMTLAIHRRGPGDPTIRFPRDGTAWRASLTPDGPATIRMLPSGAEIRAQAWGPGAAWAIDQAPELVGADDDPGDFADRVAAAGHPLLRTLLPRYRGIRIGRTRRVMEALVPAIIEQKVTGFEARAAFVALVSRHGEPAPGPWDAGGRPARLRVAPAAAVLAALPGYAYHPLGLERRRADAIRFAALRAARVEECASLPPVDAYARLRALPLVGPWTAAEVGLRALGDADAVSVGDFHLAHAVCWALAGEPRGTDERMLELLAPYAGHRARAIRLIEAAGIQAPRRGPRMAPRSIAGI
jgi:3-methyladenine DNA glycosylase/8-oxoguanine DNA glycosylase